MRRHSWERISQLFKISSWIPETSLWNKCSTSLQNCWVNKTRSIIWTTFIGERNHGNNCRWLVMKPLSIFSTQRSMPSQILCCAFERSINIRNPTKLGRKGLKGITTDKGRCSSVNDLGQTPEIFTRRIFFSGTLWKRTAHKELGIISQTKCCSNSQKANILFSVQPTPLSRCKLKSKGHGKLSIHVTADYSTTETIFRIIVSANQLSLYGAVPNQVHRHQKPTRWHFNQGKFHTWWVESFVVFVQY